MIKPIRNKNDYNKALKRIEEIFEAKKGTEEFDELEILSILIEKYEEVHFEINMPDPIDAIKFMMKQNNLKQKDLVKYIGSSSKVSEVLNKKRSLSLNMIKQLHKYLNIPYDLLIQDYLVKSA